LAKAKKAFEAKISLALEAVDQEIVESNVLEDTWGLQSGDYIHVFSSLESMSEYVQILSTEVLQETENVASTFRGQVDAAVAKFKAEQKKKAEEAAKAKANSGTKKPLAKKLTFAQRVSKM